MFLVRFGWNLVCGQLLGKKQHRMSLKWLRLFFDQLPLPTPHFCYRIVDFSKSWGFSVVSVPNYTYKIVAKDLKIICTADFCIFTHFPMGRWWWLKPSASSNELSIIVLKKLIIGFTNIRNKVFWSQKPEEFDKNGPEDIGALVWTKFEFISNG